MENTWWKTLSAQPERVCLHSVIQGQIRTAVWQAAFTVLQGKTTPGVMEVYRSDTSLAFTARRNFFKQQYISDLLATGIKKTLK